MLLFVRRRLKVLLALLIPVLVGFGPCTTGPRFMQIMPGGVLNGEVVGEAVEDWSFVADAGLCALETRPGFPHSITVYCFNEGSSLLVGCMACEGKVWSGYVTHDNRARIKIAGKVYPVEMRQITDRQELEALWQKRRGGTERPLPEGYWLYRLSSR